VDIILRAATERVNILPGSPTPVWAYGGEVVSGPGDTLSTFEESYLGPVIRVKKGQRIRVRFINEIDEESIVHWHGLHVPPEMDGHPRFAVPGGREYVYEFEVKDRAGTYWYHPHPHRRTGPQVYAGLAGLFIVSDEEEAALNLPSGRFDIPIVIQDRTFDRNNRLLYTGGFMMDAMTGFLGNRVLVNGKADQKISVDRGAYRLRVLNGSNARIYKLSWGDDLPLTVIGTDGGLVEKPIAKPYVMLGPGERVDLWADFSNYESGSEISLKSLYFPDSSSGFAGGMMRGRGMRGMHRREVSPSGGGEYLPSGAEFHLMTFVVGNTRMPRLPLPERLSQIDRFQVEEAENTRNPRRFVFSFDHMQPTINGKIFEMNEVAPNEVVSIDTTELWEFVNRSGGMMRAMQMPHPVHVHGTQFQVVERKVAPEYSGDWRQIREGFIDEGNKDTVLLMPGMEMKVLLRFSDYTGLYLYHCHNLEHEDLGMMRNYRVEKNV